MSTLELIPIRQVESVLTNRALTPWQRDDAWLVFDPGVIEGLRTLREGDEVILLTSLDRARRDVLPVHPRGDTSQPEGGAFSTRSPDRPNPSGLHHVVITAVERARVRVRHLEALDGTPPILDVKPVLSGAGRRRRALRRSML